MRDRTIEAALSYPSAVSVFATATCPDRLCLFSAATIARRRSAFVEKLGPFSLSSFLRPQAAASKPAQSSRQTASLPPLQIQTFRIIQIALFLGRIPERKN